jgi:glycolate oxidase
MNQSDLFLKSLEKELPVGMMLTDSVSLAAYGYDGSTVISSPPLAVVNVQDDVHVQMLLRLALEFHQPVIPRGAGTGLAGGSLPEGGVVLNFTAMDRIIEIDTECLMATVQPGVITAEFQKKVESLGFYYPPDPASLKQCTLGGNAATCAGGPRCLKYGVTREYVRGIRAVLPGGELIEDGGKYLKSSSGYSLSQLFTGSEGTLGALTSITLRLLPHPETEGTALALFASVEEAAEASNHILRAGILPSVIEFVDRTAMDCVEEVYHPGFPERAEAFLLLECDGSSEAVEHEINKAIEICSRMGAIEVQRALEKEARDLLWQARRSISPSLTRIKPNKLGEDICVPRNRIVPMVRRIREIAREHRLRIPVFGHIGDGNLHPNIIFDMRDAEEVKRVEKAAENIILSAAEMGGTLSGEHGIGSLKSEFLKMVMPKRNLHWLVQIKKLFDPQNIMNPGKIYDNI